MIKQIEVDFLYNDDRGTICQILSKTNNQVNYLFTKKGSKRGQHYHRQNQEYFYIIEGKVEISAYSINDINEKGNFVFKSGDLFVVEPFYMHDFEFLEDTRMIVVYDLGVAKNGENDIFTR